MFFRKKMYLLKVKINLKTKNVSNKSVYASLIIFIFNFFFKNKHLPNRMITNERRHSSRKQGYKMC